MTAVEKPELLEGVAKDAQEQSWALENKLSDINERYNRLLILLSEKGSVLNQSWLQLRDYHIKINQLLPWLSSCEHRLALIMQSGKDGEDSSNTLKELKVLDSNYNSIFARRPLLDHMQATCSIAYDFSIAYHFFFSHHSF